MGPGMHWGEWWGQGIQRGYGLTEKRFSLFNTGRWFQTMPMGWIMGTAKAPPCCRVVPVLTVGNFKEINFEKQLLMLTERGSVAAPGFMKPEGIMVWHVAAQQYFKATIEGDEKPKGQA